MYNSTADFELHEAIKFLIIYTVTAKIIKYLGIFKERLITMSDNIFKTLRLTRTERTVMRGEGKKIAVKKPFTTTQLAEELHISQATVDNAENGTKLSLSTVIAYHDYFHVPYSTLLGETECIEIDNIHINMELGLSDNCISSIKSLSPISLAMLNTFLGKGEYTELFFYSLANVIFSMTEHLKENGNDKSENGYLLLKQHATDLFIDYMKNITFKDLKKILLQLEYQQKLINNIENSDDLTT